MGSASVGEMGWGLVQAQAAAPKAAGSEPEMTSHTRPEVVWEGPFCRGPVWLC